MTTKRKASAQDRDRLIRLLESLALSAVWQTTKEHALGEKKERDCAADMTSLVRRFEQQDPCNTRAIVHHRKLADIIRENAETYRTAMLAILKQLADARQLLRSLAPTLLAKLPEIDNPTTIKPARIVKKYAIRWGTYWKKHRGPQPRPKACR